MKILMVLESIFPRDERVEKEIESLIKEGHEIRIATYTFAKVHEMVSYHGYYIYKRYISQRMYKMGAAILVLPFYFRYWKRYINSIYDEWNFDAIHIHDLPLAKLGYQLKKRSNILFIADQHEFYSSWINKTAHYNSGLGIIVKLLSNWVLYEKKYLNKADLVCTVEEPLRELYINKRGLMPDKVIVIPNTPMKSVYQAIPRRETDNNFNLLYCGGLDKLRGLDTAIKALPIIRNKIPSIRLIMIGKPNKHYDPRQLAAELGVENQLLLKGWVDYLELPFEIDKGDICFFTPQANREEIHNTIATKIYQYLARGKPVIVGSARYMKEFVVKNEVGLSINEKNPEEFAEAVVKIYSDNELRQKYSRNALKIMEDHFWEKTVIELLNYYQFNDYNTIQ